MDPLTISRENSYLKIKYGNTRTYKYYYDSLPPWKIIAHKKFSPRQKCAACEALPTFYITYCIYMIIYAHAVVAWN